MTSVRAGSKSRYLARALVTAGGKRRTLRQTERERERERERDSALAAIAVSKRQLQSAAEASPRQPGLLLLIFARQRAVSKPTAQLSTVARVMSNADSNTLSVYI